MRKILYLGTDPAHFKSSFNEDYQVVHYPVIQTVPRQMDCPEIMNAFHHIEQYSHFIFTSKNCVTIFFSFLETLKKERLFLHDKCLIAIGKITHLYLKKYGFCAKHIAKTPTQEGVIEVLKTIEKPYVFLPKSSIARKDLEEFLKRNKIRHKILDLYDTVIRKELPLPDLCSFSQIIFTSPSTVRAFLEIFHQFPKDVALIAIGPITGKELNKFQKEDFLVKKSN